MVAETRVEIRSDWKYVASVRVPNERTTLSFFSETVLRLYELHFVEFHANDRYSGGVCRRSQRELRIFFPSRIQCINLLMYTACTLWI